MDCDAKGGFTHLLRFETSAADGPISLAELVGHRIGDFRRSCELGMVTVAESAGLVGAALRRSPAAATGVSDAPFKYPGGPLLAVLLHRAAVCAVAGLDFRAWRRVPNVCPSLPCFGPLEKRGTGPKGHFSCRGVFSYRPLQKGSIDLKTTVTTLFEDRDFARCASSAD